MPKGFNCNAAGNKLATPTDTYVDYGLDFSNILTVPLE